MPPFLGEAFGGCAGLVDLGDRKTRDQASHPEEDPSLALSKVTGAANRTPILDDHGKHNPIAEVADFLKPELQLLVRAEPVLKEAANRRSALEDGLPNARPSKTASSARSLLVTASRSRRFAASMALCTSSTRSGVVDSSDIALALHGTDALALIVELRERLPAAVLALVLAVGAISTGSVSDEANLTLGRGSPASSSMSRGHIRHALIVEVPVRGVDRGRIPNLRQGRSSAGPGAGSRRGSSPTPPQHLGVRTWCR